MWKQLFQKDHKQEPGEKRKSGAACNMDSFKSST